LSPLSVRPVLSALALLALAGCATQPGAGPYAAPDTTKYTVENTEKFVLLDAPTLEAVTCTGLQERLLPDSRLDIVANVKNREGRRIEVQIQCVFKNEQGLSVGDETPWQTLVLADYSTEAVHFTALNPLAKRYTIRVRQAR
jgi:uncharacterized protein YcfL